MKRNIPIIALLLAAALPLPAQTHGANPSNLVPTTSGANAVLPQTKPVAVVNGAVLTDRDLLREMYAIFPYAKQHNGFPRAMEADIRQGALKMIEFEELVYQEAKRRHMTIAPERLAKAGKRFRAQFGSDQDYREFLKAEANGSIHMARTKIERSLLIEDLLKAEVTKKSWIPMAEARAFYAKYPERFNLPESYALQSITIMPPVRPTPKQPAPPAPTPQQWKEMYVRAENALRQARSAKTYEEFGILAEKISEDDYRVMMGNHGNLQTSDVPPVILQAISKLQPGQISDLIQTDGTYTIIRVNAHTPARTQKFDEAYNALRVQMRRKKEETLRHELDAKLRKNAKIEEF